MLEKTEGAIKNGQSRDTGNIGHTRCRMNTNKSKKQKKTQHRKLKRWATHTDPKKKLGVKGIFQDHYFEY